MLEQDTSKTSVQFIKGVGPWRTKILEKLGVSNVEDLLHHFPYRYEDRRHILPISKFKIGETQTLTGTVITSHLRYTRKRFAIFEAIIGDDTGTLSAVWFNQPYLQNKFTVGAKVILYGKVEIETNHLQIVNPEYEIISDASSEDSIHTGRIVPIYPLTSQISQRQIRTIIKNAMDLHAGSIAEILPPDLRHRLGLIHISSALKNIHFPESPEFYREARQRLVFDEFFLIELISAYRKKKIKEVLLGVEHRKAPDFDEFFSGIVPFTLTQSQKEVIVEIEKDMMKPHPMYRLLQGDVGSGKTIVAVYAMLLSVSNGYQAALMAPTEILAEQHFALFKKLLHGKPCKVSLIKGKLTLKAREKNYQEIQEGKADIVIGTHALVQEGLKFKKLGLCVIDEQHKFGVLQRKILKEKGLNPDMLVMTATPIPRTLSMALYSDMDISILRELPPGRKPVTTWWVSDKKRLGAYNFIKKEIIEEKKQAYIVYPLVEESEKLDLRDATKMYEFLKQSVFKEFKVGLIHGRLPSKEKDAIMRDFKNRNIDVLVSTIVIEVGIDVSTASVMLIEHAERFGLAQLHQLRGRVGRGDFQSYCILVSDSKTEDAKLRMNAMVKFQDGFEIAERDLRMRGPGEFLGLRQHGFPEFKIADLARDIKILELAKKEAFDLIDKDCFLSDSRHQGLLKQIQPKLEIGLG